MMSKGCCVRHASWLLCLGVFLAAIAVSQSYETTSTSTSTGYCVGSYCNKQTTTTTNYNNGYNNGYNSNGNSFTDDTGDSDNVGFGTMIFLAVLLVVVQGLCILYHCSNEATNDDSKTSPKGLHKPGAPHGTLDLVPGAGADVLTTHSTIVAVANVVAFAVAPLDSKV
jgi:hypothetical protein